MLKPKKNKRGQVGETISWIIATLVIIGIIILFLYISSLMGQLKTIGIGDLSSDYAKFNPLTQKTVLAEQLNSQNKNLIENILNQSNNG